MNHIREGGIKMKKIISALLLIVCIFSFSSCTDSKTDLEKLAEENTKKIVGTWVVEGVKKGESESLADMAAKVTTNMFFGEKTEIQFLSNGTFTSSVYNFEYEMVDNQFIFSYKDQTYAYDCELTSDKMILSIPNTISVALKKQEN